MEKDKQYYESLDKRTKEYKEWKESFDKENSIGLGDVVEKITEKTGIKKAVKFIAGEDCGCKERKEKLNKVRFTPVRCFTEEQYNQWTEFKKQKTNQVTKQWQREVMIPIYAHLFARQLQPMNCCIKQFVDEIDKVYNTYQ